LSFVQPQENRCWVLWHMLWTKLLVALVVVEVLLRDFFFDACLLSPLRFYVVVVCWYVSMLRVLERDLCLSRSQIK
jgi:hypothetical protein